MIRLVRCIATRCFATIWLDVLFGKPEPFEFTGSTKFNGR